MIKYPKTFHFSFSENLQNDDRMLESDDILVGKQVVVTEKTDGENTGISRDHCHARSLDSRDHASRHWIKSLWGQIRWDIPEGLEIFGENMFACHSIFYDRLTTYFYVFAVVDANKMFLSWEETKEWAKLLGLETVPELYVGPWDEEKVKSCWTGDSRFGPEGEGYVVRNAAAFPYDDFTKNVGKMVRKGHVQTSAHWMSESIRPNKIVTLQDGNSGV